MRGKQVGWGVISAVWLVTLLFGLQVVSSMRGPRYPFNLDVESGNPAISYRLKPNAEVLYDGLMPGGPPTTIRTNSEGFRDSNRTVEKSQGIYRILVLGDSMAFGLGVEQDEPFPAVLENLLNRDGKSYEVLNLGILGYNTQEEVALFKEVGARYSPDLVILQFTDNDLDNSTRIQELMVTARRRAGMPDGWQSSPAIERAVFEQLGRETANMTFAEKWATVEGPMHDLRLMLNGTPVILLSFSFDAQKTTALDDIGTAFDWTVLHVRDIYGNRTPGTRGYREMIVHPKDSHPSPEAHRLIAEALLWAVRTCARQTESRGACIRSAG